MESFIDRNLFQFVIQTVMYNSAQTVSSAETMFVN